MVGHSNFFTARSLLSLHRTRERHWKSWSQQRDFFLIHSLGFNNAARLPPNGVLVHWNRLKTTESDLWASVVGHQEKKCYCRERMFMDVLAPSKSPRRMQYFSNAPKISGLWKIERKQRPGRRRAPQNLGCPINNFYEGRSAGVRLRIDSGQLNSIDSAHQVGLRASARTTGVYFKQVASVPIYF